MSAHSAAPTRRFVASLSVAALALGMAACSGSAPTAPAIHPDREPTCAPQNATTARYRVCPQPSLGVGVD